MENTQENPTSQNPTPADEAARQAAEAATPQPETNPADAA
ncbi:MAG: nucleotide exchange factor GrpE, partial [Paraburkholderia sp.]